METLRKGGPPWSVQAQPNKSDVDLLLGNDGKPLFYNGKYRTTTLGLIRQKADIRSRCLAETPIEGNDFHCDVLGLTPEDFASILSQPPTENPRQRGKTI